MSYRSTIPVVIFVQESAITSHFSLFVTELPSGYKVCSLFMNIQSYASVSSHLIITYFFVQQNLHKVLEWLESREVGGTPELLSRYKAQSHALFPRARAFLPPESVSSSLSSSSTTTITTTTNATSIAADSIATTNSTTITAATATANHNHVDSASSWNSVMVCNARVQRVQGCYK